MSTELTVASKEVRRILGEMTPALRKVYDKISERLNSLARVDIVARHELGTEIVAACGDQKKYGEHVVENLAGALGLSTSQIYQWRDVAAAYSKDEIKALSERLTSQNTPISFEHVKLLASVHDLAIRKKLTSAVFKECLSSRDLLALIHELLKDRAISHEVRWQIPRSPAAALAKLSKLAGQLAEHQAGIDQVLFTKLSDEPGKYASDELVGQIEDTCCELEKAMKTLQSDHLKLNSALDSVRRALRAKEAENKETAGTPERLKKKAKTKPAATPAAKAAEAREKLKHKKKRLALSPF